MLKKIGEWKEGIVSLELMDSIKLLISRYDACVKAVDQAMLTNAVRLEKQRNQQYHAHSAATEFGEERESLVNNDGYYDGYSSERKSRLQVQIGDQQLSVDKTAKMEEALERSRRFEKLRKDVHEVMEVFQDVKELVAQQNDTIDAIEVNTEDTKQNAQKAEKELQKAVTYKHTALGWGVAGAALGGVIGGPFGLWVGAKTGAFMGLAMGGATGAIGAIGVKNGIRKAHEDAADDDDTRRSTDRKRSCSEITFNATSHEQTRLVSSSREEEEEKMPTT